MDWEMECDPETVSLTKEMAAEFANMERAPRDRGLSERRLNIYRRLIEKGRFRPLVEWASAYCRETEETYRINGKHTSTLFSSMEELPSNPSIFVTVQRFIFDTIAEVAAAYETFDSKHAARNARDIYLSFAGTVPELEGMSAQIIVEAIRGISYYTYEERFGSIPTADRAELILDHSDFVQWYDAFVQGGRVNQGKSKARVPHLRIQSAVAAMIDTWDKNSKLSDVLWTAVRDETDEPGSSSRELAMFLRDVCVDSGNRRFIYYKCLKYCRCYFLGEDISPQKVKVQKNESKPTW